MTYQDYYFFGTTHVDHILLKASRSKKTAFEKIAFLVRTKAWSGMV